MPEVASQSVGVVTVVLLLASSVGLSSPLDSQGGEVSLSKRGAMRPGDRMYTEAQHGAGAQSVC